jgi:hypothetical protein
MMIRTLALTTSLSLIALSSAQADAVSDFFIGKSISLIISTGVGGGVDTNARLVAKHLGNHIPGNPSVTPKNMTGAGHLQATNYLYAQAPRDGTSLGAILPAFVGYQVLDGRGAQYDARNFNYLGSSDVENANLYTSSSQGIKSIEQIKTREVLMGATGAGSYTMLYPTLLNNVLGYKFKIVSGYKSTNEIHLAMERGEVYGRAGNFFSSLKAQNPDWLPSGKIDMLLQILRPMRNKKQSSNSSQPRLPLAASSSPRPACPKIAWPHCARLLRRPCAIPPILKIPARSICKCGHSPISRSRLWPMKSSLCRKMC